MKALKIAGIVALIFWMVWATKELMDIKFIAVETCGLVTSKMANGGIQMPVVCPDLYRGEAKQEKSN